MPNKTNLMLAIEEGNSKAFRNLLPTSDVNAQDANGNTALHYATKANNPFYVNHLLLNGANPVLVNKAMNTSYTYTMDAILAINPDDANALQIEVLLKRAMYTESIFEYAKRGEVGAVKACLLYKGYSMNSQDERGNTALHYAIENGHAHLAYWLIAEWRFEDAPFGVNIYLKNHKDESSIDLLKSEFKRVKKASKLHEKLLRIARYMFDVSGELVLEV